MTISCGEAAGASRSRVVVSYWRYYSLSVSDARAERLRADDEGWSVEAVDRMVSDGDSEVVEVLAALADGAGGLAELAYLGAGPIEHLLVVHGERFASQVEVAARVNEPFRTALRCAWFDRHVAPDIAARLRRSTPPLRRPALTPTGRRSEDCATGGNDHPSVR